MSITIGLLVITGLAFIISMLVGAIIWLLCHISALGGKAGMNEVEKQSLIKTIKAEADHFSYFQRIYRNYWNNSNAPTNELIAFYHGE